LEEEGLLAFIAPSQVLVIYGTMQSDVCCLMAKSLQSAQLGNSSAPASRAAYSKGGLEVGISQKGRDSFEGP
jgi:hypothetical protein